MKFNKLQILPPQTWEDFEDLCLAIWKKKWKYPEAKKNGRKGQEQNGVDIFGKPEKLQDWAGVQCKGKDNFLERSITEKEILKEIEKAKNFTPSLTEFTFATTTPRDAKIQEFVREQNDLSTKSGGFKIDIYFWEDIKDIISQHNDIIEYYYSDILIQTSNPLESQQVDTTSSSKSKINGLDIVPSDSISSIISLTLSDKYNEDINYGRELLERNKPVEALYYFQALNRRIGERADNKLKFRLITNIAASKLALNKIGESASLFIEAFQYDSENEKALCNRALAHLLTNDYTNAKVYAAKTLRKNPANGRAYGILIHAEAESKPVEDLVQNIPETLKNSIELMHFVGLLFQKQANSAKALVWFHKAYELNKSKHIEVDISYAHILLEIFLEKNPLIFTGLITSEDNSVLTEVVNIYNSVWDRIVEDEFKKSKISIIVNKSVANRILKKHNDALIDINIALNLDPENSQYLKQKCLLSLDLKDEETSKSILKKLHLDSKVPEMDLIFAEFLADKEDYEGAIGVLKEANKSGLPELLRIDLNAMLVDLYLIINRIEEAKATYESVSSKYQNAVAIHIAHAKILFKQNQVKEAKEILRNTIKLITTPKDTFYLADELFEKKMYLEAAQLYAEITNINSDNRYTRRLLHSYYSGGDYKSALQLSKSIRKNVGLREYITEIEIDILGEVGDWNEAIKICNEFLGLFPDNLKIKVRKAYIDLVLMNFDDLNNFFNEIDPNDYLQLPFDYIKTLVIIYREYGKVKEAIDILYKTRRLRYDDADAHMLYISNFFMREKDFEEILDNSKIVEGMAFCIQTKLGNKQWYIIDDCTDADLKLNEIKLSHPLSQVVLNKKLGFKINAKGIGKDANESSIVEIKHKYVFALHESLERYHHFFPDREDFQSFATDTTKNIKEEESGFPKIFEQIDALHDFNTKVMEMYKKGQATIGGLSNFLGRSIFEVLGRLMSQPDIGVRCAEGQPEKIEELALELVGQNGLVLDITGILIAYDSDLGAVLRKSFGELLVVPSTLDIIREQISIKKGLINRGQMIIGKEGEKYIKQEITAEQIQQSIDYYNSLLDWISENCTITPCYEILDCNIFEVRKLRNLIEVSCYDSVMLAQGKKKYLYSDDLYLRSLAKNEYNVKGVWTQVVLISLVRQYLVDEKTYFENVIKLVASNYKHTSINAKILIYSAEKSNWLPTHPLLIVLNVLSGKISALPSAINVASDFIKQICITDL